MEHDLVTMSREECLELLPSEPVGRLAVTTPGGYPFVVPVNFVLDGEVVVFRTAPGTKLTHAKDKVSFEVDHIDPTEHTGWSVLVQGRVYEATHWETDHLEPRLETWSTTEKNHWLRIVPNEISGRRIVP